MFGLGVSELLVILVLVVLLFGSKKIPELAKGVGMAMNEFKKTQSEQATEETPSKKTTAEKS